MNKIKIPTILGLLVLVIGVFLGVFLVQQNQVFRLGASPDQLPQNVKITNISDAGFTISWTTEAETSGFISWGETKDFGRTSQDDRDQADVQTTSSTHHVTLRGLKPSTDYFFKIGSGRNLYDNQGIPYMATTGPTLATPGQIDLLSGMVTTAEGNPSTGVIVYLNLGGASGLSVLTNTSGNWFLSLSTARSVDLTQYATYDPKESIIELLFQGGKLGSTSAQIRPGSAKPVPPVVLGQPPQDFRNLPLSQDLVETPESSLGEIPEVSPSSGFKVEEPASPSASVKTSIKNPDDKELVNTARPEFNGTGDPGGTIEILVESSHTIKGTVKADSKGNWKWSPPQDLEPGEHKITVSYRDSQGILRKITRSFTVLAAGTSDIPAFTSTPSATPTTSASVTPTPTKKPTPTSTISATPTTTSSTRTSLPSTDSAVPESGTLTPTFAFFIMGIGLIFIGIYISIKTKGSKA